MNTTDLILLGIIVGLTANNLDQREGGGVIGPVLLGILGSFMGAVLATLILNSNIGLAVQPLIVSSIGSLLLLLISGLMKNSNKIKNINL